MKQKIDFLKENLHRTGTDLEELRTVLEEVDKITVARCLNLKDIQLLSLSTPFSNKPDPVRIHTFFLECDMACKIGSDLSIPMKGKGFDKDLIIGYGADQEFIQELEERTKLMFLVGNSVYFVEARVPYQIGRFIGLYTSGFKNPSLARDLLLIEKTSKLSKVTNVVIRSVGRLEKIMTVRSQDFEYVPLSNIFDVMEHIPNVLGSPVCAGWDVKQTITECSLEYPEKAEEFQKIYGLPNKVVPYLKLRTSDIGESSLNIESGFRVGLSTRLALNKVEIIHRKGYFDYGKLETDLVEKIFPEIESVPKRLCELMEQDLTDGRYPEDDRKKMERILMHVFQQLKMSKAVSQQSALAIRNALLDEMDFSIPYTAYDICIRIMEMPERINARKLNTNAMLLYAVAKAPFAAYTKKAKKEAPVITLTA